MPIDIGKIQPFWLFGNGVPASGLGEEGDVYWDLDSSHVYIKTDASTWTDQGQAATRLHSGVGLPSGSLGEIGDWYIWPQVLLFAKTGASTWTLSGDLRRGIPNPLGQRHAYINPGEHEFIFSGCAGTAHSNAGIFASDDQDGTMVIQCQTGLSTSQRAGVETDGQQFTPDHNPVFIGQLFTDADISGMRIFCGFSNSAPTNADNGGLSSAVCVMYSHARGDTNWQLLTDDGASATITDLGVAIATATYYRIEILHNGSGNYTVNIYDLNQALLGTWTGTPANKPGGGVRMQCQCYGYSSSGTNKQLFVGRQYWEAN